MATIQSRKSRGHKYWYIVESRRVNGKPRPITLAYLGKPADLLARLKGEKRFSIKSYSHGDSRALLEIAEELGIVQAINESVVVGAKGKQPIRDGLTVGASLLLAALGRACHPTSKRGWHQWAKGTDLDYVLKINSRKLDSQHFWDQMDVLPVKEIPKIEEKIVRKLVDRYGLKLDLLLLDYTNFFTFIDSANTHCEIPQRGKNKQRRIDLRQIGLALLVSRKEQLPLFHYCYRGNKPDVTVFKEILEDVRNRITSLTKELEEVTIVFDKGNNSKANLADLEDTQIHYVGSLTPAYNKELIEQANKHFTILEIKKQKISVFRTQCDIWGSSKTVVVYISEHFRKGQIRGIRQELKKKFKLLESLKIKLQTPEKRRKKRLTRKYIERQVENILQGQYISEVVSWDLQGLGRGRWELSYGTDEVKLQDLASNRLGRRILMTDRHSWSTEEIMLAYRSQTKVEYAFRNFKNPFHGALRPSYHWTDQKLQVHSFTCVLADLLTMVAFMKAKQLAGYHGSVHQMMEELRAIRIATILEEKEGKRGRYKIEYKLEQLPEGAKPFVDALNIKEQNMRSNINVGVYS